MPPPSLPPPARGEVWLADLDPVRGHELAGCRPVVVFSVDRFNQSHADLVVVLPITSTLRDIPFHVVVHPPEGGLTLPSAILCEAVRSMSKDRLVHRLGRVSPASLTAIADRLRILLDL